MNAETRHTADKIDTPLVSVGIVGATELHIHFEGKYTCGADDFSGKQTIQLHGNQMIWDGRRFDQIIFTPTESDLCTFALEGVTIGIGFHWERKERQVFRGQLRLVIDKGHIHAINILSVEDYLKSVISSEMSATASLQLLKAHAVISRGWLLAQIEKRKGISTDSQPSYYRTEKGYIRWYDREDHTLFDVCADDHCQRYQGITRQVSEKAEQAVNETAGEVLMHQGRICDTRFSKCCGGMMEEYSTCWEDIEVDYLRVKTDRDSASQSFPDLTKEEETRRWIINSPSAFCNTTDRRILSQVLNNYDQETTDFYRWKTTYTQEELSRLINEKLGIDLGCIIALRPIKRGKSGRICELEIVGERQSITIGKELEIRRVLSTSHLLSSAFVVDCTYTDDQHIPDAFTLHGAGWGHGVGLCQIGAAMMGEKGYNYKDILLHYYQGATLKKIY